MTERPRFDNFQIAILRSLAIRGGSGRAITPEDRSAHIGASALASRHRRDLVSPISG
jgi:hypothetical protein